MRQRQPLPRTHQQTVFIETALCLVRFSCARLCVLQELRTLEKKNADLHDSLVRVSCIAERANERAKHAEECLRDARLSSRGVCAVGASRSLVC